MSSTGTPAEASAATAPPAAEEPYTPLKNVRVEPTMLQNTLRANMFPETRAAALEEIKRSLVRAAWTSVRDIESVHKDECARVAAAAKASGDASASVPAPSAAAAAAAPGARTPPPTLPAVRHDLTTAAARRPKLRNVRPVEAVLPTMWLFFERDRGNTVQFLAAEEWEIGRCGGAGATQVYRVHYFRDDNSFWTRVVPQSPSGLFDWARFKVQRWWQSG